MLADFAADLVEARERDRRDAYDRRLDIPFYYLRHDDPVSLVRTLELTERYRAAGLWYWRRMLSNPVEPKEPEARRLLAREQQLVTELRGNLFLRLLPFLPQGYGQLTATEVSAGGDGAAGPAERDLRRLAEAARDTARDLGRELDEVARRLAEADPGYAAARPPAQATVDAFVAMLTPR